MEAKNYYSADIADTYDKDPYDLYKITHEMAIAQLKRLKFMTDAPIGTVLDFSIGTGTSFLLTKKNFTVDNYIGNDISPAMLEVAKKNFPNFTPICGDARDIIHKISPHSVDLIYMYYLFSYISPAELFPIAKQILRPGAVISIISTTKQMLLEIQELLKRYFPFFDIEKVLKRFPLPENKEHLIEICQQQGFKVLECEQLKKVVTFHSHDEVLDFSVNAGWNIQFFDLTGFRWLDTSFLKLLVSISMLIWKELRYPVSGTTDLVVMTLQIP